MFRQIGWGAAAVLTAGILAVGCSDDSGGDTIISGDLTTDNYSGNQVQDNNVSDDQRAFTNAGTQADVDDFEIYWNTSNDDALAIYTTNGQGGTRMLWAAHYNGSRWGTPVNIVGVDQDVDTNIEFKALWLNTGHLTDSADAEARARDGDAIILFTATNEAPAVPVGTTTGVADVDPVNHLYASYFDVSEAGAGVNGTVQHGFQSAATQVDFLHTRDNGDASFTADAGVSTFGFVSDSLHCTHEFTAATDRVDSGDATNFVYLVHRKDPTDGDPDLAGDITGERYIAVQFNLNATDNVVPQATGPTNAVLSLPTGFDTTSNSEQVGNEFVVHNGHMIYQVTAIEGGGAGDQAFETDTLLAVHAFTEAGSAALDINSTRTDDDDDSAGTGTGTFQTAAIDQSNMPDASNVYGGDQGLPSTYILFTEEGFDGEGDTGERAANRDLMLARLDVDPVTGATTDAGTIEIDAFEGTDSLIDLTSNEATDDNIVVRSGDFGNVDGDSVQSRINRTGSGILVLYLQENADTDDVDDTDQDDGADATDGTRVANFVLRGVVIQTRQDSADTRSLVNSVSPSFEAGGTSTDVDEDAAESGTVSTVVHQNVESFRFQANLAQGQAKSQAEERNSDDNFETNCDLGCVMQANRLRMNWTYTQGEPVNFNEGTAVDQDEERLFVNGLIFVPSTAVATAPAAQTALGAIQLDAVDTDNENAFSNGNDTNTDTSEAGDASYGLEIDHVAFDAGDTTLAGTPPAPAAAAGRPIVLFTSIPDADVPTDATASGALENNRLFVSEVAAGNTTLVVDKALVSSTASSSIDLQVDELVGFEAVPVNEDTVNAPNYVADGLHIWWTEDSGFPGSSDRLMTRAYDAGDTMTTGDQQVLANRFQPPLSTSTVTTNTTEEPVAIDNPFNGILDDFSNTPVTARNGTTAAIWFEEAGHLYQQEISSLDPLTGYTFASGAAAPNLVDNESFFNDEIQDWRVFLRPECDDLPRAMTVWEKDADGGNEERLLLRVHN